MKNKKVKKKTLFLMISIFFATIIGSNLSNLEFHSFTMSENSLNLKFASTDSYQLALNLTWVGPGTSTDIGYSIALDASGNIYITGRYHNDVLVAKYDSSGILKWNKTWDH